MSKPKRRRNDPWNPTDKDLEDYLDRESLLFLKPILLVAISQMFGHAMAFAFEHPEDPESNPLESKSFLEPEERLEPNPSFWSTNFFAKAMEMYGGTLHSFDQGALGHEATKPTSVWTNLALALGGLRGDGQPHVDWPNPRKEIQHLSEQQQWNMHKNDSKRLARWAPLLRM